VTAEQIAEAIAEIVECEDTKANKARALFDVGCDRSDVVELLDMSYSQAHSIWKKRRAYVNSDGSISDPSASVRADGRGRAKKASGGVQLDAGSAGVAESGERPVFHLSPHQTRYIQQDGHYIVRVDTRRGPEWLGFIHEGSPNDPTDIQDHYVQ
jgi:hypothetical protein